jgi:hypothetical protein
MFQFSLFYSLLSRAARGAGTHSQVLDVVLIPER